MRRANLALATLFALSGSAHFVFRDAMALAVPQWLPHRDLLAVTSGILEVLGAIGLLVPAYREVSAWCLIGLLVAVFPANIWMLVSARAAGGPLWAESLLWMRLPLQPLLIWFVYRTTRRSVGDLPWQRH